MKHWKIEKFKFQLKILLIDIIVYTLFYNVEIFFEEQKNVKLYKFWLSSFIIVLWEKSQ